jgi:hypothetical protein
MHWRKKLTLATRLKRIGRLSIAPIKGFFKAPWKTLADPTPRFDPEYTSLWAHLKEVARKDTILFFEPFVSAVREFREELAKPYERKPKKRGTETD